MQSDEKKRALDVRFLDGFKSTDSSRNCHNAIRRPANSAAAAHHQACIGEKVSLAREQRLLIQRPRKLAWRMAHWCPVVVLLLE
jgi:hypothetical protein